MLYNLLGPGISFYRKFKINIEIKPKYAFYFSNDDFRYKYKSNDGFFSPNS